MQNNNSPRFIKSFMIGLIASSAGAFVALPGAAMPEPGESISAAESIETIGEVAPVDAIIEPTAEETLPMPEAAAVIEADAEVTEEDAVAEEPAAEDAVIEADAEVTEEDAIAEETAAEDAVIEADAEVTEEDAIAEEPAAEDAVIEADAEVTEEDAIAEETAAEDAVIEADAEVTEEDIVEAAEIEALDEEPIADDAMEIEEPIADDAMEIEEPIADDAMEIEEPVADDAMEIEEPIADDAMEIEEPVADDATETEETVAEEDINTEDFTIAELTNNNDSFEVLAAALAAADLTEILGSEGPFTVFAPTDEAFAELPEGAVEQLLLPENKDILVQVLTYHVVPSTMLAADLATGGVSTVEGSEIAVAVGDTITVDNANVVFPDLEASNGVIHVIDRVILPPAPESEVEVEESEAAQ